jgi:hypothetical protein
VLRFRINVWSGTGAAFLSTPAPRRQRCDTERARQGATGLASLRRLRGLGGKDTAAAIDLCWACAASSDILSRARLHVPIQPKHPSRIPSPVVAFGAPEAVLELGQALVLAEAVSERRRADRRHMATAEARHLQDVPRLQVAKPDGVLRADDVFAHGVPA